MILKAFSWHEASIDTPAEEICQEMWEQLVDGQTDTQINGRTDRQLNKKQLEKTFFAIFLFFDSGFVSKWS